MSWPFHVGSESQLWDSSCLHCWRFLVLVMQVFLAKRRHDEKYYAVKVLQKKVILNRKEVILQSIVPWTCYVILRAYVNYNSSSNPLLPNSKSTSWQNVMCCWRMWNTLSWLGFITPSRPKTSCTSSWISSTEEKWVVSVLWIMCSHRN